MNKTLILISAIGLTILTSCRTIPARWEKVNYVSKDTVIYNTSYKDTTIYIPEVIASIDGVAVSVDSLGKAQLDEVQVRNDRSKVEVKIVDGKLTAKSICAEDSLKLLLQQRDTYITSLKNNDKEKVEVKTEKPVKSWVNILNLIGAFTIGFIVSRLMKIFSN